MKVIQSEYITLPLLGWQVRELDGIFGRAACFVLVVGEVYLLNFELITSAKYMSLRVHFAKQSPVSNQIYGYIEP
jgi:hypothetical protein